MSRMARTGVSYLYSPVVEGWRNCATGLMPVRNVLSHDLAYQRTGVVTVHGAMQ